MSNFTAAVPTQPLRADALAGVRSRRMLAVCFDLVLVSVLVARKRTEAMISRATAFASAMSPKPRRGFPCIRECANGWWNTSARWDSAEE